MTQPLSISQWVGLLKAGKKLRFSRSAAGQVRMFIRSYCDFKVMISDKADGMVVTEKAPHVI